ncbi:MAG: SET domain-containing protein [bacterium]|nr:SET domain-containing protein [bacterium]MDZ4231335.1 SET domain-containing protein [Patescibacteria group bacterium]
MEHKVEYKRTKSRGRGVFALKDLKRGQLIEEAPVIVLSPKDSSVCERTILDLYIYPWKGKKDGCLALGYGSLYNHSFEPNAEYDLNYRKTTISYTALHSIKKGDEVLVNYNGNPDGKDEVPIFTQQGRKRAKLRYKRGL